MRKFSTICAATLVALSVSACGSGGVKRSEAERYEATSKAIELFQGCIYYFVPKLDDGRSDASTIADAVLGSCRKEAFYVIRAQLGKGASEVMVQRIYHGAEMKQNPLHEVLRYRREGK